MIPQAPHGWPQPSRAAHHAAPHRPLSPLGQHAGRALRLFAAAGTGAAGLCAVVGSVVLVAAVTAPARATHAAAPAVFTGRGSASTRQFTIGGNGTWTLQWSYSCAALGHRGSFVVSEDGTDPRSGVSVSELGTAGHGVTRTGRDAGTHHLAISSPCAWALTILPPPAPR